MHPEKYCHRCFGRNLLSWYADNDVWNKVVNKKEDEKYNGIICPICFAELAKEKGVNPTAWRLSTEGDSPEVDKLRLELNEIKEKNG